MADQDDTNPFDNGTEKADDGLDQVIGKLMDEMEDGPADDGGLDQTFDVKDDHQPVELVGNDEAAALIDKAEMKQARGEEEDQPAAKDADKTKEPDDAKAKEPEKADADADADKAKEAEASDNDADKDKAPDLSAEPLDKLLEGLPDDRRAAVSKRIADADAAMKPFQTAYMQGQMKLHGASPIEAATRLVDLASFAAEKPDEYIAWVAGQMAEDESKIGDVLSRAAKFHGLKVVPIDDDAEADDDDPFADEESAADKKRIKELEQENARLKNGDGPAFGPDVPARRATVDAATQIQNFASETNEQGQPLRPFFDTLKPQIAAKAQAYRAKTGKSVEVSDLQGFYDEAVEEMRASFGNPSAATPPPAVPEKKPAAADTAKAKAASKSVDGTGQGASRRPALAENASLEETIRHFAGAPE